MIIECSNCKSTIAIPQQSDGHIDEIACGSCGSVINIRHTKETEWQKEKAEMPIFLEIIITISLGIAVCFWYGRDNALFFMIPVLILAVPIDRKLRKEWPDWAEVWFLSPFDKARFMLAAGISALIVLPSYFCIIKPLTS